MVKLTGTIVARPSPAELRQLMATLSRWQARPVSLVLSVAGTESDVCWAQLWDDALAGVPAEHVEILLEVHGAPGRIQVGHER